ncbi:hypothetical protein K443DRAFT_92118 [Laccaria amethystina LaAM-08-1]|uniref:Uncharacterized protein n=1 Tax=Laccaria amethystina LaAM-08-1 TaxID=1095629 RepID=A0A0C9XJ56_9AGAR|nr:hypothetical protein K443DRAFT_92118 [Laccaria amethystina LaAM-08-1]
MWIGSQPLFTARRPNVSPPGYQSPTLGDSVPVPGSQDTQRVTPQPGVTISSLSRTPRLFTSVTSQTRTRREVNNEPQVSQWWGHRGLLQHEVLEAPSFTSDKPSLPTHESYAQQYCLILDHSVKEEPPPDEANSLPGSTLTPAAPGNIQPYTHPEQPPTLFKLGACQQTTPFSSFTMSSTTPSVGDDTHRNKTRNTNNSASREIVTPLTTRKKGKGVSMAEVADPEAYSPTNGNSMPSSGPVLTGPHPTDKVSPGETLSHPAAPQSAKRMPAAAPKSANNQPSTSRSTNVQTAASKSANNSIKAPRRSSTSGASHPAAPNQQPQLALPDSTPTFRDDMLNLQAAIQKETVDYDTQTSSSSHTEGRKERDTISPEHEESEYRKVFWDIDAVKDIPIWAEPVTRSTQCMFGKFDPSADEDVLVPLGAIDGVIPGSTKHECDQLRCAIELIYNTPKDCRWDNLGAAVRKFTEYEVSRNDLVRYTGLGVTHGIERTLLLEASQVVVTVDQVLQVLANFFRKRDRERFVLDQQFAFLRLIASHTSRTEVLATYRVLQHRTKVADW